MAKTKDKVLDAAGRREAVRRARAEGRGSPRQRAQRVRVGPRGLQRADRRPRRDPVATRVATDKDIQDELREAVDELREAADRVQGKEDHGARNTMLLLTGIALGHPLQPGHRLADAQVALRQALRAERRVHVPGRELEPGREPLDLAALDLRRPAYRRSLEGALTTLSP